MEATALNLIFSLPKSFNQESGYVTIMGKHGNPFCLENDQAYLSWRQVKLNHAAPSASDLIVNIKNISKPTSNELGAIRKNCKNFNFSFYATKPTIDKYQLINFAGMLGLNQAFRSVENFDANGVTEIKVAANRESSRYVPYTNKPLSWHTDGYYSPYQKHIQAFVLHCICPAESGGMSTFLDPEIVYIRLRDLNPEHISNLMARDSMSIPANISGGTVLRPMATGPVFWVRRKVLHMRYTARKNNIIWKPDKKLLNAKNALENILNSKEPKIVSHKMEAGQGVICNNVLHKRDHFTDNKYRRLVYRARFLSRIS